MKYQVLLQRALYHFATTVINAESDDHAAAMAHAVDGTQVKGWELTDDKLSVVSVAPFEEVDSEACQTPEGARVPVDVRQALRRMVDYLYDDEAEDYQTLTRAEQREHIFEAVLCIARWLAKLEAR